MRTNQLLYVGLYLTCLVGCDQDVQRSRDAELRRLAPVDTLHLAVGDAVQVDDKTAPPGPISDIYDVLVVNDSLIFIRDPVERLVRVFARDGSWLRNLGGPGEGPGEFRDVGQTFRDVGETVLVFDRSKRRMSRFSVAGEYLNQVDLVSYSNLVVIGSVGRSLVALARYSSTMTQPDSVEVLLIDASGGSTTVHKLPPRSMFSTTFTMTGVPGEQSLVTAPVFASVPQVAADSSAIVIADNRTGWLHVYDTEKDSTWVIDTGLRPALVRPSEIEEYRAKFLGGFPGADQKFKEFIADLPASSHHPLFDETRMYGRGVWLLVNVASPRYGGCWLHIAIDASRPAEVMCSDNKVVGIGNGIAVTMTRDELDVPTAKIVEVVRAPGGAQTSDPKE